jgi:hypothetical protein
MEVALFDAVTKALQRTRLIRVSAVNENPRLLPLERKPEVDIATKAVGHIHQAEFIKLIINLGIGVLKHVLLTLEDPKHRTSKATRAKCHTT